jgi:hypothetical protein
VYTEFRPTPLQHYIYPAGADGLYLVVDEKVQCISSILCATHNNNYADVFSIYLAIFACSCIYIFVLAHHIHSIVVST